MKIYVGNLSRQAEEGELRELFAQFGEVKSVKVMKDGASGEPRGFAFVEMTDAVSANTAIKELDYKEFLNRRLKVNEARPKTPKTFNSFSSAYGFKNPHGY